MSTENNHIDSADWDGEDPQAIAANVERYLNNHTREGGHAWQMNMAARPQSWHPLEAGPEPNAEGRAEAL